MDFRHLRAFVTIAEERNFTRAAQRLHISQPPLTRQIRQLEEELGVTLFIRKRTGVEITVDGRALLDVARTVVDAVGELENRTHALKKRPSHVLSVAIAWGLWKAVNLIRERHAVRCPDMRISAGDVVAGQCGAAAEHNFDVAIMRTPLCPQFDSEPLFHERFAALISSRHPLATRGSVKLSDLVNEPLLLFNRGISPAIYDKTLALWQGTGLKPTVLDDQPAPYAQGAMMLVASGQGYYLGITSPFTQTHRTSGVSVVPLDEPHARSEVLIAWRRNDSSKQVKEFIRSAREVFPANRIQARTRRRSA